MPTDRNYSTEQAAKELGVAKSTLLRWFRQKRIEDVKRDRNGWRVFTRADIMRNQAKGWVMARRKSTESGTRAPRFIAVDFFCGAGGTTRGLLDAGGYVIAGIDKDARCARTYLDNNFNESIDYSAPRFLQKDVFPAEEGYLAGSGPSAVR